MNITARNYELLTALVRKDFKVRYKSTALGFLWSMGNPIMFALVFWFVFRSLPLREGLTERPYLVFLLAGLFPWQWFSNTVNSAPMLFILNAGLVKKVYFPRIMLPISLMANGLIHFLLALLVAIPVLAFYGIYPTPMWLLGVPLLLMLQSVMTLGILLFFSSVNVFFRDLEFMTLIMTQLLFFLTPILYSESILPESTRNLLRYNPVYYIVPAWRNLILDGILDYRSLAIGSGLACLILMIGVATFRRLEWRFAETI